MIIKKLYHTEKVSEIERKKGKQEGSSNKNEEKKRK